MSDKIYFQWQNKILRKTIYPARDMKLRHFLLYYYEIDLWEEYKDKKLQDIPDEIADYEAAQKQAVTDAFHHESTLRTYFCQELPDADLPVAGDEATRLKKLLVGLHADFGVIFKKYLNEREERSRDRKEKIFVAMRVAEWERYRRELSQRILRKKNLLGDPNATNRDLKTRELDDLEHKILPRLELELNQLKEFVAAQNKLEKRKEEFDKREKKLVAEQASCLIKLAPLEKQIKLQERDRKRIAATIARLSNPPQLTEILNHFSTADIYQEIRDRFTQGKVPADDKVVQSIIETVRETIGDKNNTLFSDLVRSVTQWDAQQNKDPAWILGWIKGQAAKFQQVEKKLENVILALESGAKSMAAAFAASESGATGNSTVPPGLKLRLDMINILSDSAMKAIISEELERLDDLCAAIDYAHRSKDALAALLTEQTKLLTETESNLTRLKEEAAAWQEKLDPIDRALHLTREKFLSEYIPEGEVSIRKNIVPFKSAQYYAKLEELDHDALLHEIFRLFWKQPERFPLWLQYMVVHFSGMRYASAHGSWADPRDMLLSLRTLEIQDSLKYSAASDDAIKAYCDAKIEAYALSGRGSIGARSGGKLPKFARGKVSNNNFALKLNEYYLPRLGSERPETRRRAFLELSLEEEYYEIQTMKSQEILEELKAYKDELPVWMWKEIVKLTDLRLTEVTNENWETLTVDEQNARLANTDKLMWKYREILNDWKQKNLTGWRQEHDRANRLIVTRAVCNEVAEHIQHLRGHMGAAGLTQKPLWYTREEKNFFEKKLLPRGPRPYFVKAKDRNDFEVGASILWLRFVHDIPNEWRVAKPMATREGDGLIPAHYLGRQLDSGGWVYKMGEPISRSRLKTAQKRSKSGAKETQWLRWMHEATVATVAETAEDTVVLTFETALPYEDPSLSTIGVFKRYLHDLTDDLGEDGFNPAFVGFVPEGQLPAKDLEEMLNWNHILLKKVVSPSQLESYRRKYIRNRKPSRSTIQIVDPVERPASVMALKPLKEYEEWIDRLAGDPKSNLFRVKKWGQIRKGELDVNVVGTSNFQAVSLCNDKTGFGAVSNYIYLQRDDIDRLRNLQVDDEYARKQTDWRSQKMTWLCRFRGSIYMYENRKDSWIHSPRIRWGTLVLGGNLVQVVGYKKVKPKGRKLPIEMAVLAGFRKADWHRPLDDLLAEGLVHRCFCAYKNNQFGDSPQGIVYSPFYSLLDWDFCGKQTPRELYIPVEDLYKPELK